MHSPPPGNPSGPDSLLAEIVETLDACGIESNTYQLYEYIDVDALKQLIDSADESLTVQFTVEGVKLSVSPDGVDLLIDAEQNM